MQAFCGFSAVFLAFIIPYFDDFCTVYRMIGIVQFTLYTVLYQVFSNLIQHCFLSYTRGFVIVGVFWGSLILETEHGNIVKLFRSHHKAVN